MEVPKNKWKMYHGSPQVPLGLSGHGPRVEMVQAIKGSRSAPQNKTPINSGKDKFNKKH